jgi:coenzyme PQQ precursor peptide PqqA
MEEWDKPEIIETPVGLEINSYACAAMGDDEGDDDADADAADDSEDDADDDDDAAESD